MLRVASLLLTCQSAAAFLGPQTRPQRIRPIISSRVGTATDDEMDTVEEPNTTLNTPFQIFQDHTLARPAESETLIVVNELDTNINVQDVMQPIVTWKELQRLASSNTSTPKERYQFAQEFQSTVGYILLELEGE